VRRNVDNDDLRLGVGVTRLHFVLAWEASDELRQALNEETLRAFRNADRFTTFKVFRRPGAL
jgi:hypothetical protein